MMPKTKEFRLGVLFVLNSLFTIILTIIPVVVQLPDIYTSKTQNVTGWFGWNDVLRIIEPVIAICFQILIFVESGILSGPISSNGYSRNLMDLSPQSNYDFSSGFSQESLICTVLFGVFASIYQQGAGLHTAATMFKHSIETLDSTDPDILGIFYWMRTVWEHLIAHYMYAAGGILLSFLYAYLYRNFIVSGGIRDKSTRLVWAVAVLLYGVVIGSVAIEFPSGSIVALVLITFYGFVILGGYLFRMKKWIIGFCPVIQYFVASYFVAFLIVIGWIVKSGGFVSRNVL